MIRNLLRLPSITLLVISLFTVGCSGHCNAQASSERHAAWDVYSDTWVATDALMRTVPDARTTKMGAPHPNRTLGMFYFLTFDPGGGGPYDNTQILKAHPEAILDIHHPAWGPLNESHYWGEPLLGYYLSDDAWVLRKHAQMLVNAGVDVVIFDNSNAVTYDRARTQLCQVWEQMRKEGCQTPQIAFLCPFGNSNGMGTSTLGELYDTLYAPGLYRDLWFLWNGKPLVMAYPSYADAAAMQQPPTRQPAELISGEALGQTWIAARPFTSVGGEFPTWATSESGMTLSLRAGGPNGKLLLTKSFKRVRDNATLTLDANSPLPAGRYFLEMSHGTGHIGWWGFGGGAPTGAYQSGLPVAGARSVFVRYDGEVEAQQVGLVMHQPTSAEAGERARKIREFFTFRTPIAPYDIPSPPRGGWAWLQNYPQAPQLSPAGAVEQITVGVAQNYNSTTHLAPMSFPGAYGRSYHNGSLDTRPDAVRYGYNFEEQWRRALEVQPPFVFVTGWNEWTAGFYSEWAGYKAPPPIFVDEFNEEFSRDIEPMRDGHGDDYYYQLVSNVRKYKGVRTLPPVSKRTIPMKDKDSFDAWKSVLPEYRDYIGDTMHRDNAPGVGHAGPYNNRTGRNDIVAAKVCYDSKYVYFFVRTDKGLTPHTDPDWMLLYINSDANYKTGWLGYDFVINRHVGDKTTSVERCKGVQYRWEHVGDVRYVVHGNEMQVAVPRSMLGVVSNSATIDFKWADHCFAKGDWTDFTLNGDAAPDDRFNYRAVLGGKR